MRRENTRSTTTAVRELHESCEVRGRIFEYFQRHRARGLRETLLGGERTRAYATMRRTKMYDISIFFAKDGKMWTYIYSRDVDGEFDRRVLGNIGKNHLPRVASFVDCSSEKRFQKKSRVVCKLIRDLDWKLLDDKSIGKLLEDYNWFAEELQHIGLFED